MHWRTWFIVVVIASVAVGVAAQSDAGSDREVRDLNAFESLGFLIVVGLLAALGIWYALRVRKRMQGGGPRALLAVSLLVGVLSLAPVVLPDVAAQPEGAVVYGVHELSSGQGAVALPSDPVRVCVRPMASDVDVSVAVESQDGVVGRTVFLFDDAGAACQRMEGPGLLRVETDAGVRVLLTRGDPDVPSSPGVMRLSGAGSALRFDAVGDHAEVGVLSQAIGTRTQILDADTLAVLARTVDAQEVSLGPADGLAGRDVVVVLQDSPVEESVLVRWEDPDWYARAPPLGAILAVVAAGLFVVLFRGRPPRA